MADMSNTDLIHHAGVLFVGAGPVGLYTAIQAKLKNPSLNIVMLERHQTYLRHHILIIDKASYHGAHPDAEFQALLKPLCGMVPTSTIETSLLTFAKQIGIQVVHEHITSVADLMQQAPKAQFIVGSDGAKSLVRREIFNDEKEKDVNLQYIIEVKYKTKGPTKPLGLYDYFAVHGQCGHFIRENIGKLKDGETPVSLFFFVDEATYNEICSLNNGPGQRLGLMDIDSKQSNKSYQLSNSIRVWLAARRHAAHEAFVLDSEKIAAVALPIYSSKHFVTETNDKTCLLVGDAAMGVPYFRALNAGLIAANHAAKLIAEQPQPQHNEAYQEALRNLAQKETAQALFTDTKVHAGMGAAYMSRTLFPIYKASSMDSGLLNAIQSARLAPPNVMLRHPRTAFAPLIWGAASVVGFILNPISTGYFALCSLSALTLIIVTKLNALMMERPVAQPSNPLPWEVVQEKSNASAGITGSKEETPEEEYSSCFVAS